MNEHLDYLESTKARVLQTVNRFEEKELDKNNFCVMPFVNIILEPNGSVGLCRHKGTKFSFGNIATQTIDEIWTSQAVQDWREGLLNGKNQICKTELVDRKCNLCPELNSLLDYADISNTKDPKILRLTANLNGKCNLQCQFCDVWSMPNGFYTEENFWIPARKRFFREIREVDMLSGEPFIQPDTYRLMDEVSEVNPDCQWTLTTNLHWKLTEKVKSKLDKIVVKNIIASIDSLDEGTYHRIRKPGNLNVVLKTLDDMKAYEAQRVQQGKSELHIRVNFLIQKDNWREVQKMIQFCLEKKVIPFITFLYIPDEFSLLKLPILERVEILNFYFKTLSKDELLLSQRVLKPLIRSLDRFDYAYFMEMFHERIIH